MIFFVVLISDPFKILQGLHAKSITFGVQILHVLLKFEYWDGSEI